MVYVWRFVEAAYLREPPADSTDAIESRWSMLLPAALLVGATVYFGFDTSLTLGSASQAAGMLMGAPPMTGEQLILAALVAPTAGAALIALFGRAPNLRDGVTLISAALLLLFVLVLLPDVLAGERPGNHAVRSAARSVGRVRGRTARDAVRADCVGTVGRQLAVFDRLHAGQRRAARKPAFMSASRWRCAATMGIAMAGNMFTLFLFYEMLTLITYPLVTHHGTDEARRGGRVYLGLLLGTSIVFLLPALVFTWFVTGTTDFDAGGILDGKLSAAALGGLLALYMFGIGKAALMPFHRWLPAAMVAPTPVSALLHAVAVVKAGVFSVVKVIVYVFGIDTLARAGITDWLVGIAGFTIVAASVVALNSDNLKRRLAYSTVSQLSYVVLAAALLVPLSIVGAVLHIAAHALGKITLFFAAGAIYTAAHKTEVSQLDGIGRRMPWTMGAFAIGALSMIGLPPAAGFISKWYMLSGAMAGAHWIAVAVIAGSTLLNAGYFLPIVYRAFLARRPTLATTCMARRRCPMVDRAHRHCNRHSSCCSSCPMCRWRWRGRCRRRMSAMDKTHWLDEPRNVKLLWRVFLGVLALTVMVEAVISLHPHFAIESVFGFYAWFGFIACAVMIVVAKASGTAAEAARHLLRRAR